MNQYLVVFVSILCITGLAITALLLGEDGAVLASAFTVIGGLGGYAVGKHKAGRGSKGTTLPQPPYEKVE